MLQLILFVLFFPLSLFFLRAFWSLINNLVSIFIVLFFFAALATSSFFERHSKTPPALSATPSPCAALRLASGDATETARLLCRQYLEHHDCRAEIEAAFLRTGFSLDPATQCEPFIAEPEVSIPLVADTPPPLVDNAIATPDDLARAYLASVSAAEFQRATQALLSVGSEPTKITAQEAERAGLNDVFQALAIPTTETLATLTQNDAGGNGIALPNVPPLTPFMGIVRGVYQRSTTKRCAQRLRNHSLCVQIADQVKCNLFDATNDDREEICVDYLIK